MPKAEAPKRLSRIVRRESILDAAQSVFAKTGFEGARTQQIADAAGISEALIYKYFPSKHHLYVAVLKRAASKQDTRFERLKLMDPGTETLIGSITEFMVLCSSGRDSPGAPSAAILLASLAGNNSYARLVYRRSRKLWAETFERNIIASIRSGDANASSLTPVNAYFFVEHVGTMMLVTYLNKSTASRYNGDKARLVSDAVWFACRGIGVTDEALHRHFKRLKMNTPM